jgi:hypothetical protein
MDQRKVEILEGTKLQKEPVFFLDAKFFPLVGLNLVDKTSARVIGDFLQKRAKGVGIRYRHTSFI